MSDGVIMCKLMLQIDPKMMGIHVDKDVDNYKKRANFNLAINTASSNEIRMSPNSLHEFLSKSPEPILNFLYECLLKIVSKNISAEKTPELMQLGNVQRM